MFQKITGKKVLVLYRQQGLHLHLIGQTDIKVRKEVPKGCIVLSTRLNQVFFPMLMTLDREDIRMSGFAIKVSRVDKKLWPISKATSSAW